MERNITQQPNIFDFATGELSQDAFLAWLASWANDKLASIDPILNQTAKSFLKMLCNHNITEADIDEVKVKLQYKKTDVLIDISLKNPHSKKHLIIIEDKTGTGQRSGQLKRYKEEIEKDLQSGQKYENYHPHFIYYKTHDHLTYELHGFRNVTRADALNILDTKNTKLVTNQIFIDYVSRLRKMENDSLSYTSKPWMEWEYAQWNGFLMALCQRLGEGANFGYVPNASGGFIGAWFGWTVIKGMTDTDRLYIQLGAVPKTKFDMKLRISSANKEATENLKTLILPLINAKFKTSDIKTSSSNIRKGKTVAILTFEELGIVETNDKVERLAQKIETVITFLRA